MDAEIPEQTPGKPFNEAPYDPINIPFAGELEDCPQGRLLCFIISQVVFVVGSAIIALLGWFVSSLFRNETVTIVTMSVIIVLFLLIEIESLFLAWIWRTSFRRNVKVLKEEALPVLRCMHLAAWAEPVYKFDADDITMEFIQGNVVLSKEGPTAGQVVSGSTGEVLPLK